MKPAETKLEFIKMRAAGDSYQKIADSLHISKDTCSKWENQLAAKISELKAEQLNELYESYYMTREARIKKLGGTLASIEDALSGADLNELPPEKLLDFKLKYAEALKNEYIHIAQPLKTKNKELQAEDIMEAIASLLNRVRNGDVTTEQANRESTVLANLLKAYDTVEIKTKLDTLEALMGDR